MFKVLNMKRIYYDFDFMRTCEYLYSPDDSGISLCIKQVNNSVAVLNFIDDDCNKVNIPEGIVVYTTDYQNSEKKVILKPIDEYYSLCWTDDYIVEFNKKIIINVKSQRKWMIT